MAFRRPSHHRGHFHQKSHFLGEMPVRKIFIESTAHNHRVEREGMCTSEAISEHRSLAAPARWDSRIDPFLGNARLG